MWLRKKPKHCLCNSTDSHKIRPLCQRILQSCLIHVLCTFSTAYFSLLIEIIEEYTYFHPNSFLIAICIAPWSLPGWYHYIATYCFSHLHEEDRSHIESEKHFSNWNATWYIWVGKTLYIVDSSIIYTYDIDNTQTIILKIPWFHTPSSHYSQNEHDTMEKIVEWKLATMNLFHIFCGGFFNPSPDILTKYNIKEISSTGNILSPFYLPRGKGLGGS